MDEEQEEDYIFDKIYEEDIYNKVDWEYIDKKDTQSWLQSRQRAWKKVWFY